MQDTHRALAAEIAAEYAQFPQVEAVTLAGSQSAGRADEMSDLDMYVYVREPIPLEERRRIATAHAIRADIDNRHAEPGEEWIDIRYNVGVDVMFRHLDWIEDLMARSLERHEASGGFSTAFWYNVRSSDILFDRSGWFEKLQTFASQPYPEPLREAIVLRNYPQMRRIISSHVHLMEKAVARDDLIALNQIVTKMLANYFDIIFAVNRMPHPGEKRLLTIMGQLETVPVGATEDIPALIRAVGHAPETTPALANRLIDALDAWLEAERLLPLQPSETP